MMLVSVLGTVLAASAAVVPVGAVPCTTKGKTSGAPSQTPSPVVSGPEAPPTPLPSAVAVEGPKAAAPDSKVPAGVDGQASPSPRPKCTTKPAKGGQGGSPASTSAAGAPAPPRVSKPCPKRPIKSAGARPETGGDGAAVPGSNDSGPSATTSCTKCAANTAGAQPGPDGAGKPAIGGGRSDPQPSRAGGPSAGRPAASKPCAKGPVKSAGAGPKPGSDGSGPSAPTPCTKCAANTAGAQPGSESAKGSSPGQPGLAGTPPAKPTCSKRPASGPSQAPKPAAETSDAQKPKSDDSKVASDRGNQGVSDKNRPGEDGDNAGPKDAPRQTPSAKAEAPRPSSPALAEVPRPSSPAQADAPRPSPSTKADPPRPGPSDTATVPQKAGDSGSSAKPAGPEPSSPSKPTKGTGGALGSEIADKPGSVSVTPHEQYSSSVGVLGCKIDTNSVAYWPGAVGCNDICIKLTSDKTGKSRHLLRIDSSTGARDISYHAWRELTGMSAGGGEPMTWEWADMSACSHLLDNGKMPIAAYNGIGYPNACMAKAKEEGSSPNWLSQNFQLFNYAEARCENGPGNECSFDSTTQQVDCGSTNAATGGKGPGVKDVPYNSL